MKHLILLFLFFCSVSCSSNAQEQPVPTSSADTIPAQKITLLFAGDLMQHQAQIDAARTATAADSNRGTGVGDPCRILAEPAARSVITGFRLLPEETASAE